MPDTATKPIEDSVTKVDGEVAVGEDLEFQRKWWRFERGVWIFFTLILILDVAGVFGRGPVAHAARRTSDGSTEIKYERIERAGTPSILTVSFAPSAVHDGKVRLFVSQSIVKELGAQRVIPSPESTALTEGGLTYTFPASSAPAPVEFALQPPGPGVRQFTVQVQGDEPIQGQIVVVP